MKKTVSLAAAALFFTSLNLLAATHYVDLNSANPTPPYTNWLTAATNIQDAANAAGLGDTVLVTNGIYQYGGVSFNSSNRVYVASGVTVQSLNGPAVTTIVGYQVPGTTNGASAVRCVYLREFASLSGFTLTNGATQSTGSGSAASGGGVVMESQCVVSNCIITGNAAYYSGGGAYTINAGALVNCIISRNVTAISGQGGGAYGCVMANCVISNNNAYYGGGLYNCGATNCLLTANGNTNNTSGGAAYLSTLNNCTVVGNFEHGLGAADTCTLNNCIVYYNTAFSGLGSDCYSSRLTNCCALDIETVGSPVNCITNAPGFVNYSGGDFHLNPWSRCVDAGTNVAASSETDLDGNPRIVGSVVDMGCYENQSPLTNVVHYVSLNSTNPVAPYTNWLTAATNFQDAIASAQSSEFVVANDGVYTNGGTVIYGAETNRVALTNGITLVSSGGSQATTIVGGTQMRCVYVGSNSVLIGFTITNGHARTSGDVTNEQTGAGVWCETDGVVSNCFVTGNLSLSASGLGGGIFGGAVYNCTLTNNAAANGAGAALCTLYNCLIVTNGWLGAVNYGGGLYFATASNCVITANRGYTGGGGAYRSVLFNCALNTNSSQFNGGGAYLCFLTNCTVAGNHGGTGGALLSTNYNCTFSGNSGSDGGGVDGGISYNCVLTGNSSINGGGALNGTFYNCLFTGNFANIGGGAENVILNNCTVVGNTATNTGGGIYVFTGSVNNSIVYYNFAPTGSDYSGAKFNFSCSFPGSSGLVTTNPPLFVDTNADFHLLSNSPCINSGNNSYATNGISIVVDLDGNPRIVGGTADLGAYEYQSPASILSYAYLQQYGLATDGSADYVDTDGDGMNNYAEWRAGTNPTNAASVLALQAPAATTTNATITWQSVSGVSYYVQRGSDLSAQPGFSTIQSNIVGQAGTTSYTDDTATNSDSYFYRVGVQ